MSRVGPCAESSKVNCSRDCACKTYKGCSSAEARLIAALRASRYSLRRPATSFTAAPNGGAQPRSWRRASGAKTVGCSEMLGRIFDVSDQAVGKCLQLHGMEFD